MSLQFSNPKCGHMETDDAPCNCRARQGGQVADVIRFSPNVPASETSISFHQGMVDRMAVSFHKYGPVAEAYPEKVDAIKSLVARLERYANDGNTEWLMDVANFAMIEFMHPAHPKAHYRATDSRESPGRVWQPDEFDGTVETSQRTNDGGAA